MEAFVSHLASRVADAVNNWDSNAAAFAERYHSARVVAVSGWLVLAAGAGLLLTTLLPSSHRPDPVPFRLSLIAAGALALGYRLIRISAVAAYRRSQAEVDRDEIVYARPFGFDTFHLPFGKYRTNWVAKVGEGFGNWDDVSTFEDYAVAALSRFGRVICLANPQRTIPFGALKLPTDDITWRDTFIECVQRARLAVIVVDNTDAVLWEVRNLYDLLPPDRVIMLLPFRAVYADPDHQYERLCERANELVPAPLPSRLQDSLALWYDCHRVCHTVRAHPGIGTGEQLVRALAVAASSAVADSASVSDKPTAPSDWTRHLRHAAVGIFVWCCLLSQLAMRAAGHCEHAEAPLLKRPYISVGQLDQMLGWCQPDAELVEAFRTLQIRLSALTSVHGNLHGVPTFLMVPTALRGGIRSYVHRNGMPRATRPESDAEISERRATESLAACEATGMLTTTERQLGRVEDRAKHHLGERDRAGVAEQLRELTATLDKVAVTACHSLGCEPLLDWPVAAAQPQR